MENEDEGWCCDCENREEAEEEEERAEVVEMEVEERIEECDDNQFISWRRAKVGVLCW